MSDYGMNDSGQRAEFDSGMVRDITEGKVDWSLIADGPMLPRWANHLTQGAVVKGYGKRNWMLAKGDEEYERFRESAFRHFMQWYYGETEEDHAAAVFFNINGAEYVQEQYEVAVGPGTIISEATVQQMAAHARMMAAKR